MGACMDQQIWTCPDTLGNGCVPAAAAAAAAVAVTVAVAAATVTLTLIAPLLLWPPFLIRSGLCLLPTALGVCPAPLVVTALECQQKVRCKMEGRQLGDSMPKDRTGYMHA